MLAKPDTARLFFAAWPPPQAQQALSAIALRLKEECGGRALAAGNIHLTLAFLGETARDLLPRLEKAAATVAVPPFDVRFDRVGYWRHNRVVWAGAGQGAAELDKLATGLAQALTGAGFRIETRAFVPHVTLLRNARRAPAAVSFPPVAWQVTGHVLVESVPVGRTRHYRVLRAWPTG